MVTEINSVCRVSARDYGMVYVYDDADEDGLVANDSDVHMRISACFEARDRLFRIALLVPSLPLLSRCWQ